MSAVMRGIVPRRVVIMAINLGLERLPGFALARGGGGHDTDKYAAELSFQRVWAGEFRENKLKVLEYWRRYRFLDEVTRICGLNDGMRILDVGCGISTVLHFLDGERFGIDPLADEYLSLYDYPQGFSIKKGYGEDIDFPDGHFDVVFCSNALDHTSDPRKSVEEMRRVLRSGGFLVLTVELFPKRRKSRDSAHPHSFTRSEVHSLCRSGFKYVFEGESPWIGLQRYVRGIRRSRRRELVMILKKAPRSK